MHKHGQLNCLFNFVQLIKLFYCAGRLVSSIETGKYLSRSPLIKAVIFCTNPLSEGALKETGVNWSENVRKGNKINKNENSKMELAKLP